MKSNLSLLAFILLFMICCDKENKNYYSFTNNTWENKDKINFNIEIKDSITNHSTNISLRHSTSYKYQNIIIFVHHYFNKTQLKTDTVDILLAQNNGRWRGTGKNNIKEIKHTYNKNNIYQKGTHVFELELAMREKNSLEIKKLEDILDISLFLTEEND